MDEAPVPKPRPLPPTPPSGSPSKKPVPLPRLKNIFSKDESNDSTQSSPKQSMAQLFKEELIGKHTRRLARNIIPKRFTSHYENTKEPKESPPEENRLSLPISLSADHIFNSISFASPLRDNDSDSSDSVSSDTAPPLYPPPPPPDDIDIDMEDSLKEIDTIYEQLRLKNTGEGTSKPILRSDSWSFYDTIGSEKSGSGSNLYVPLSAIRPCTSDSVGSELSALDVTDGSPSSSRLKWDTESESSGSTDYREKATKSVLLEFDPLCGKTSHAQALSDHDLMIIAGLLPAKSIKTSNYGRVNVVAAKGEEEKRLRVCLLEEAEEEVEERPPPPPMRFDSISPTAECAEERKVDEEQPPVLPTVEEAEGDEEGAIMPAVRASCSADGDTDSARFSLKNHWPSMKKVIKLTRKESKNYAESLKAYVNISQLSLSSEKNPSLKTSVDRPVMEPHLAVQYGGYVYRPGSYSANLRSRELQKRWCSLSESKLTCSADKSSSSNRDVIPLDTVLSVQLVATEHRTDTDGETVYCFEVNTTGKVRSHLFGVSATLERRMWMQKILENFTVAFSSRVATGYTRFGWCYLKEGIGGSWVAAWILLYQRSLQYCPVGGKVQEADLRKVRSITLQEPDSVAPIVLLDFAELSVYLRTEKTAETISWRSAIRSAATDNGPELQNQQMTQNDVPVIVDKCLKFVDAHGAMSEGIYRRSGANTNVTKLLTKFREDAWAVQLSKEEFSEYDVASVLKRFFRDLPEPLLTTELHPELCQASTLPDTEERIQEYKELLNKLPLVQKLTLRRLLAHLQFIHELNEYNLMPIDNLAAVWGPTLMHVESTAQLQNCLSSTFRVKNGEITWSQHESKVVMDLITLYTRLFTVDAAEVEHNQKTRNILKRLHTGRVNPQQSKPTGDLMVWVHIGSKESGNCVQITVGPQKLCGEVCTDLCSYLKVRQDEVVLEEIVLGGHLKRILHYSESVLDTVLRWGYWDEADRRDNYLVLRADNALRNLQAISKFPLTKSGELRFADQKTKSFKTYLFSFSKAKLCYYKDKRGATKLAEWPIEDIVWYEGHEAKRSPNTSWSLTFIHRKDKVKRTKDSPYFGCTLGGTTEEDKTFWMAAFYLGQYPNGLVQPFVAKDLLM